jgi:hypothetical protein
MQVFRVIDGYESAGHLLKLLSEHFDVRFEPGTRGDLEAATPAPAGGNPQPPAFSVLAPSGDVFSVILPGEQRPFEGAASVRFANGDGLDAPLRGQRLRTPEAAEAFGLGGGDAHEVLAWVEEQPIWTAQKTGGRIWHRTSVPLPALVPGRQLSEFLNGEYFLKLLPLYHFVRRTVGDDGWASPPLRGSVIIDDPNLHARSYGRLDYPRLLQFVRERNCHVAMATVPLDSWFVSGAAARIFRENVPWLSLIVHGNNHTRDELAQPLDGDRATVELAGALRRIGSLEVKSGVKVGRVMAPPHGVCAAGFMTAMMRLGFDGLTTNRWSLWKHNKLADRPASVGLGLADILAGGLPVVNRFRFNSVLCQAEIVIAAYLGQPLIAYGHHQDFDANLEALSRTIDWINALGDVRWMSMAEVFRTNFRSRTLAALTQVRMYSRRIKLVPPPATRQLEIQFPGFDAEIVPSIQVSESTAEGSRIRLCRAGEPVPVTGGNEIMVSLGDRGPVDYRSVAPNGRSVRVAVHRLAVEMRDRLTGLVPARAPLL